MLLENAENLKQQGTHIVTVINDNPAYTINSGDLDDNRAYQEFKFVWDKLYSLPNRLEAIHEAIEQIDEIYEHYLKFSKLSIPLQEEKNIALRKVDNKSTSYYLPAPIE